jgi:multiple sugar transport system substrate-binding protein
MKKALPLVLSMSMLLTAACSSGGGGNASGGAKPAETPAAKPAEPVKLRMAWWGGQSRHDYTLKVIELYQQKNPNVKIEAEYAPFDDYWKKLAPQAAANQLPDIIQMDISYLTQYSERNQLADLTPYTKNNLLNVADVSKNALSGGEVGGKLFAMNLGVNALYSMIDTEALKKLNIPVPSKNWTWAEYEQMAAKAKEAGKMAGGFAFRHDVFFPYFLRTQGQKMYKEDGTALAYADDKLFVDYFKRYQGYYDKGYFLTLDKEALKKSTPEEDEVLLGNNVMSNAWSNQFLSVANLAKRPLEMYPLPFDNNNKGLFLKPSMYFSVAASSKQKEEATKFINFWINDIEANKIIKGERGVPVSSKVKDALKPLLTENEQKIFDYVAWAEKPENSSPMDPPSPVGAAEIEKMLRDLSEQILYKKISIEDAAAKFRKDANAVLAKNKK